MSRKQRRARTAQNRPNDKQRYPQVAHEDIDPAAVEAIFANAAAMGGASDVDRDWFATSPDRSYRLRPITAAELAFDERRRPPDDSGLVAYAIVRQVRPGLRLCIYSISLPFHRVENFSDVACKTLFEGCSQLADILEALSSAGGR